MPRKESRGAAASKAFSMAEGGELYVEEARRLASEIQGGTYSGAIERALAGDGDFAGMSGVNLDEVQALMDAFTSNQRDAISDTQKAWQDMYNAVLLHGKETAKKLEGLGEKEAAVYKKLLQIQANDMKKDIGNRFKLFFKMFTQVDKKIAIQAMKNPFLNMFSGFTQFKKSIAGMPIVAMGKVMSKTLNKMIKNPIEALKKTMKKMATDIWTGIVKMGVAAFEELKKILFGNVFREIQNKLHQLQEVFMSFPGAQEALSNLRAIRDTMAQATQQFGLGANASRQLTEEIYNNSNALYSVQDNLNAVNAAMAVGIRGAERQAAYMQDIARYSRITGESEAAVARILDRQEVVFRLSREERQQSMATFAMFNRGMAADYGRGISMEDMTNVYDANSQKIQTLMAAGYSHQQIQRSMMGTAGIAGIAGIDPATMTDLLMKAGSIPQDSLLLNMLGTPQRAQELAMTDPAEFWRQLIAGYSRVVGDQGDLTVFRNELDAMGLSMLANELDLLVAVEQEMPKVFEDAAKALLPYNEAMEAAAEMEKKATTPLTRLNNEIENMGNQAMFGDYRLSELLDILDMAGTKFDSLMGGFDMLSKGLEMTFGPLAGWIQPLVTLPAVLVTIGGAFGDLEDADLEGMGALGTYLLGVRDFKDTWWPKIKDILSMVWEGIKDFFRPGYGDAGESLFGVLLNQGVEWVTQNGPQIIADVAFVMHELFDAVTKAIDTLEESKIGEMLAKLFTKGLTLAIPIIKDAANIFIDVVKAIFSVMSEVMNDTGVSGSLTAFGMSLIDGIASVISSLAGPLTGVLSDLLELLIPTMTALAEHLWNAFVSLMPPLVRAGLGIPGAEKVANIQGMYSNLERTMEAYSQGIVGEGDVENALWQVMSAGEGDYEDIAKVLSMPQQEYLGSVWEQFGEGSMVAPGRGGYTFSTDVASQEMSRFAPSSESSSAVAADMARQRIAEGRPLTESQANSLLGYLGMGQYSLAVSESANITAVGAQFGMPRTRNGTTGTHMGLDLRGALGADVQALAPGTIAADRSGGDWGNFVAIAHPTISSDPMYYSLYAHLSESTGIPLGDDVSAGDVIGKLGLTGNPHEDNPHVHIETGYGWTGGLDQEGNVNVGHIEDRVDPWNIIATGMAAGGVALREMVARVAEGGSAEVIYPLDRFEADQEEKTTRLIDAIKEQTEVLTMVLESLKEDGLLEGAMGGGAYK